MWARVIELMLGVWLAVSPWVFRHAPDATAFWVADFAAALAVWLFAGASFWTKTRRAHLGILGVAVALGVFAYFFTPTPPVPAAENELLVSVLLLMLAIIPSRASEPPPAWLEYYRNAEDSGRSGSGARA